MCKSKRSSGEGSVRKLKSGNWHGEVMDGYDDNGKKVIISFSAETRAEVLDLIRHDCKTFPCITCPCCLDRCI